jgi:hypothetical protein
MLLNTTAIFSNSNDSIIQPKYSVLGYYQNGYVFQTNSFLRGQNLENKPVRNYQSVSLQFVKQTKGENLWEYLYQRLFAKIIVCLLEHA